MHKILLIEDEEALAQGLVDVLKLKGYQVVWESEGNQGLQQAMNGDYDLILLDVELPELTGFDILKALRESGNDVRVLMLSARGQEIDRVLGFELGVDDYVTKPFSLSELLGRVKALLRRSVSGSVARPESNLICFGSTKVDLARFTVEKSGEHLKLPARAFALLSHLLELQGEIAERDKLMDAVWGEDEIITQKTLNNLVVKIRQAIEVDPADPQFLKTVHGVGYRLVSKLG